MARDDAGIKNRQPQLVENGGNQCEQIVLIAGINENLCAAPAWIIARHDQRAWIMPFFQNRAGVPSNFIDRMAQEIIVAEPFPDLIDALAIDFGETQLLASL